MKEPRKRERKKKTPHQIHSEVFWGCEPDFIFVNFIIYIFFSFFVLLLFSAVYARVCVCVLLSVSIFCLCFDS